MAGRSTSENPGGMPDARGFTLVELLIALAILSILASLAAPSFRETVADVRLTSEQNRLVKALRQARAEAIKQVRPVTLCRSDDGADCGGDWDDGWLIVAELDAAGSLGSVDTGDGIIAAHQPAPDRFSVRANATIRPSPSAAVDSVTFGPRGRADWTLGTFVLCDSRGADEARAIILNGAGGLRSEDPRGGPPKDATGTDVTCP